jgi:eukaryotic translation initiation factor 2C
MDPPEGIFDRPSYASLVSSVDAHATMYIASIRVQPTRQQIIEDLYEMCKVGYIPDLNCYIRLICHDKARNQ